MKTAASQQVKREYSLTDDSCADTASESLKSVGKASGTSTEIRYHQYGPYKATKKNPIPKGRYQDIKKGNKDGKELDLNKMRNQGN